MALVCKHFHRISVREVARRTVMCTCAQLKGPYRRLSSGKLDQGMEADDAKPLTLPPMSMKSHFCRLCGSRMEYKIPSRESEPRCVCTSCAYVDYFNPKMVVGCIVEHEGKILLCRRGIEPCKGLWTIPAGFMEMNESSAAGAVRETREEALATVEVTAPYAHLDIPIIGQAYILFRAKLLSPYTFSPGPESLETALFLPDDIPFQEIAFSSISIALRYYVDDMQKGRFHVHHGVIDKIPGSQPNDPKSFVLRDHFSLPAGGP